MFASANSETTKQIGKFRAFPPAATSRQVTPASATRKAASMSAATGPIIPPMNTATRPASQIANSSISGRPRTGSRPVQFGIAVSRKPAMTAPTKPNSISCRCQERGSNALGKETSPSSAKTQSVNATIAQAAPPKKNGRKPPRRKAGAAAMRARRSASICSPLVVTISYFLSSASEPAPPDTVDSDQASSVSHQSNRIVSSSAEFSTARTEWGVPRSR